MLRVISRSEVKTASDDRKYMTVQFMDVKNPFAGSRTKVIWQQFTTKSSSDLAYNDSTPKWVVEPSIIDELIKDKAQIPGEIVTETVPQYEVGGREVNTYTAVVLGHESVQAVFKAAGHILPTKQEAVALVPAQPVDELVVA